MSIIEQAGYLMRFRLTYCVNNNNPEKCKKKVDKYLPRLYNGLINLLTDGKFEKIYLPDKAIVSNQDGEIKKNEELSNIQGLKGGTYKTKNKNRKIKKRITRKKNKMFIQK